jgi:hypothetical protein
LENPRRLVLDFPNTVFGQNLNNHSRSPNSRFLKLIRSSLFHANPPVTRVVLDEAADAPRPQVSLVGSNVEIHYFGSPVSVVAPQSNTPCVTLPSQVTPASQGAAAVASQPEAKPEPMRGIVPQRPTINYDNGLLSIDADNAVLSDVLYAIAEKTGAAVQLPMSDGMLDRVALKMGPVTSRQLLTTLLEGSRFTYFIVEDSAGGLQKLILTPKQ